MLVRPADYSDQRLQADYKVLGSQIGNLSTRISSEKMMGRLGTFDGSMRDSGLDSLLSGLRERIYIRMEKYDIVRSCEDVLDLISEV